MKPIRVLVVDDSAFARKVIREILADVPEVEVVGWARDGLDALERIASDKPDVVTLDLVMPNLDGVGVLRALAARDDAPRVVVVSMADEESDLGIEALRAGAFDVVHKPTALAIERLYDLRGDLVEKVLAAARAPRGAHVLRAREAATSSRDPAKALRTRLLVIGASTGGPQAVSLILRAFPADFPVPVALVLHMPVGYTDSFARRLDGDCALSVAEARDGMAFGAGQVIVARAGMHLKVSRAGEKCVAHLDMVPIESLHRPSVDALFTSAAEHFGESVLGAVLTGMGSDGLEGAAAIRAAGGRVITEAEETCVVYGMPRVVWEAGLADARAPLDEIASAIGALL